MKKIVAMIALLVTLQAHNSLYISPQMLYQDIAIGAELGLTPQ